MDESRVENILEIIRNGRLFKVLALIKLGETSLAKCAIYVYFMTFLRAFASVIVWDWGCVCVV